MQKYYKGDYVRIAKDLGSSMSHFKNDCNAIIIGSYKDLYKGNNIKSYTVYIQNYGTSAWYDENQLELIEKNRLDLLEQWKTSAKQEELIHSNLDWIFKNGQDVLIKTPATSIATLAACFGLTNLWGNKGEGYVYYQNIRATLKIAKPFLEQGDKEGWLTYCKELRVKLLS